METILRDTIFTLYSISPDIRVTIPDPEFGDYATNIALQLAGQLQQSPRDIANAIVSALQSNPMFSEISIAGPGFINMRVNSAKLMHMLAAQWSDDYGNSDEGQGKTVVVEYPSPNMAKPYSVGHLRPANQGWAARQLMQATGWTVITDNHLGDYGAPLGTWIVGFLHFSSEEALQKDGIYELGRLYIQAKQALSEEVERNETTLADEVQQWLLRFEAGDEQAIAFSNRFAEISLKHIHSVMDRLGISTDHELGEAFFAPQGKQAVAELLASGIAIQNDDGSVIVSLEEFGFDVPLLLQKSNGAALYTTTDLATILYREKNWSPDKVIYAVGAEQQFHFAQLFALAKKLSITTDLYHLWFGVIEQFTEDGRREKMSSRKGVVLLEELLDMAEQKARSITEGRTMTDEDISAIALGAVKFTDFISDRRTNILFDWDTIFALTGMSGPYVQYAAVRVNKILSEYGTGVPFQEGYDYQAEKKIIQLLLAYPALVSQAARDLEPHKIASFAYELARTMNRYYEATPIASGDITAEQKNARLGILACVSHTFSHSLNLLGITIPSKM